MLCNIYFLFDPTLKIMGIMFSLRKQLNIGQWRLRPLRSVARSVPVSRQIFVYVMEHVTQEIHSLF